jgi:hypothetical protein
MVITSYSKGPSVAFSILVTGEGASVNRVQLEKETDRIIRKGRMRVRFLGDIATNS